MRVPLDWLREYCDPELDVSGIEERLTMTGTKVEAIHHHGVGAVERFVVGRVLEVEPHPDADRLEGVQGRSRSGTAQGTREDRLRRTRTWRPGRPWPSPVPARSCPTAASSRRRSSGACSPKG